MLKTAILFSGILALTWSQSTPVSQCVQHRGELPLNTYIENCMNPPCQLPQLQDAVLHLIFRAPYRMQSMSTLATAYLFGAIGIPYALGEQANTCNFLTSTRCPVEQNEVVTYTLRMYIEPIFPVGISVNVEFRIVDDSNNPVICFRVPLRIVAPLSRTDALSDGRTPAANGTVPLVVELNAGHYDY